MHTCCRLDVDHLFSVDLLLRVVLHLEQSLLVLNGLSQGRLLQEGDVVYVK